MSRNDFISLCFNYLLCISMSHSVDFPGLILSEVILSLIILAEFCAQQLGFDSSDICKSIWKNKPQYAAAYILI